VGWVGAGVGRVGCVGCVGWCRRGSYGGVRRAGTDRSAGLWCSGESTRWEGWGGVSGVCGVVQAP